MARRRHGTGLTTRGQAFLGAGVTLVAAGILLGLRDFTRFGALVTVLPLLALLLDRRPVVLDATRSVTPATVAVGDTAQIQVTYRHTGARSTPLLLVTEHLPQECGPSPRAALGTLAPGGARAIRYAVTPAMRGRLPLGPSTVVVRDPFGLTVRHLPIGTRQELLVVPRTWHLEPARSLRAPSGGEGEQAFVIASRGDEDQTVREYRDGDDRRRIHWPATARTGDLMVRHEDRPGRRRAVILLDTRAAAFGGTGTPSRSFEWALSAATSIALHLLAEGYAVTLVTSAVAVGGSDPQADADALLAFGATVAPSPGSSMSGATERARALVSAAAVLVVVLGESGVGPAESTELRELVAVRPQGGDARAIIVTSPSPVDTSSPTAKLFLQAGWATHVADPADGIPEAWQSLGDRRAAGRRR